jgi:hypothetical protein
MELKRKVAEICTKDFKHTGCVYENIYSKERNRYEVLIDGKVPHTGGSIFPNIELAESKLKMELDFLTSDCK